MMFGPQCDALKAQDEDEFLEKCFSASSVVKDLQTENFTIKKDNLCR